MKLKTLLLAGISSLSLIATTKANVNVVIAGGNASSTLLFDRANALLSTGSTNAISKTSSTNSSIKTYSGSIGTNLALGTVTIQFSLLGGASGLSAVQNQTTVPVVSIGGTAGAAAPQLAVSSTQPETVGISSAPFETPALQTLVVIDAYIINTNLPNSLSTITNLTQRQAALLESASGTESLTTANLGGTSHTDWIYLVGRNTASAVRNVIDANIYFSGTPSFWTTNSSGQATFDTAYGQSSGTIVTNILTVLSNAVGTVALSNVGAFTPLAYEGFQPSTTNVALGNYPIWGYEQWFYLNSGTGEPSANQLSAIDSLYSWITDPTYQNTSSLFVGYFLPISTLQVSRSQDGGPITPNNF
jgi:hypothetical protein